MAIRKVIVVGLDGLDPGIAEVLLGKGELPHLGRLASIGGFSLIGTTYPAQTPVAWSSFATGMNPGGHGIFDFIRRDPVELRPEIGLSRYIQRSVFLPPKVENLMRGTPLWQVLSGAGIPSTVLRCPCTYPPGGLKGRLLAGLGVPDVRGGFGTPTFFTSSGNEDQHESEHVVRVELDSEGHAATELVGPRSPKGDVDIAAPLRLRVVHSTGSVRIDSGGKPGTLEVRKGRWSDWLRLKFKVGRLQSVAGIVRFYLVQLEPELALYASPVNFDPGTPMFPISAPWDYAGEVERALGLYYTSGMVEEHTGLNNGRIDEAAFLNQCDAVLDERERMMTYELDRFERGFLFCLYDTPDRVQHMFWRFRELDHPANREQAALQYCGVIEEHYRKCDRIVGRALEYADDETLFIVLSDHGFTGYRRSVNLNTWLHDNGFLALERGLRPGDQAGDLLRHVDWSRTKAYAVGFGGIYLNLRGREARGVVPANEANEIASAIVERLSGLVDAERGEVAVRTVLRRDELYAGEFALESPDLMVNFSAGYRASSGTALGAVPEGVIVDNQQRWSGDHAVDPSLVPGVLFMNRPFGGDRVHLVDMAPTVLRALGVEPSSQMEGRNVLR